MDNPGENISFPILSHADRIFRMRRDAIIHKKRKQKIPLNYEWEAEDTYLKT